MAKLEGEMTGSNYEMWRCGGSTLHPHCSTLHNSKSNAYIQLIQYPFSTHKKKQNKKNKKKQNKKRPTF